MTTPWETLREFCYGAGEIIIVAPYIKADALQRLLGLVQDNATITCVTRWNPNDIRVGASDVECRPMILQHDGAFRLHPSLHAKYYRCDDKVLVGSANLTASGMGYADVGNLEILCAPSDAFDAFAFEARLLAESREISEEEFADWTTLQTILSEVGPDPNAVAEDSISQWRPSTRDPEHVWLLYRELPQHIASDDELRLAQSDLDSLHVPRGLDREEFDAWVRVHLHASAFPASVVGMVDMEDSVMWQQIADTWDISIGEAARRLETVRFWYATFR